MDLSIEGHPEKPNPSEKLYTYRDYKIMALTNFFGSSDPLMEALLLLNSLF